VIDPYNEAEVREVEDDLSAEEQPPRLPPELLAQAMRLNLPSAPGPPPLRRIWEGHANRVVVWLSLALALFLMTFWIYGWRPFYTVGFATLPVYLWELTLAAMAECIFAAIISAETYYIAARHVRGARTSK
jgi:hypothetical protein